MAGIKLLTKGAKAIEKALAKGEGKVARKSAQYGLPKSEKAAPKGDRLPMPAVQTKGDEALVQKILDYAAKNPASYPTKAKEPVFKPADTALTKDLVEQKSIADQLPAYPDTGKALPLHDRARGIHDNREAIARRLAQDLTEHEGELPNFYSTGTILEGLVDKGGMNLSGAQDFMRDWAGQGAATSPRTRTPPNIRNAAFLMYERARGNPLTPERQAAEQAAGLWGADEKGRNFLNRPGFPMMEMHTTLADAFAKNAADPLKNSKPFTFRENWTGNMADVTADTHEIRKVLDAFDRLYPGELPRSWFDSQPSFDAYTGSGGFPPGSMEEMGIKDTLGTAMIGGRKTQTEYPILQEPVNLAARMLGISPAEMQERLWFQGGPRTGLESPPMTIPDLFNSQFETTSGATGLMPEQIMRLFTQRRIPLAEADVSDVPGYSTTA